MLMRPSIPFCLGCDNNRDLQIKAVGFYLVVAGTHGGKTLTSYALAMKLDLDFLLAGEPGAKRCTEKPFDLLVDASGNYTLDTLLDFISKYSMKKRVVIDSLSDLLSSCEGTGVGKGIVSGPSGHRAVLGRVRRACEAYEVLLLGTSNNDNLPNIDALEGIVFGIIVCEPPYVIIRDRPTRKSRKVRIPDEWWKDAWSALNPNVAYNPPWEHAKLDHSDEDWKSDRNNGYHYTVELSDRK